MQRLECVNSEEEKKVEIRIKLEAFLLKLSERVSQCKTRFMDFS